MCISPVKKLLLMRHFHHDITSTEDISPAATIYFRSTDFKLDTPAPELYEQKRIKVINFFISMFQSKKYFTDLKAFQIVSSTCVQKQMEHILGHRILTFVHVLCFNF